MPPHFLLLKLQQAVSTFFDAAHEFRTLLGSNEVIESDRFVIALNFTQPKLSHLDDMLTEDRGDGNDSRGIRNNYPVMDMQLTPTLRKLVAGKDRVLSFCCQLIRFQFRNVFPPKLIVVL